MSFDLKQVKKAVEEEKKKEDEPPPPKKPTVLKDLDFSRKLYLGADNRKKVLAQIGSDCKVILIITVY